VWRDYYTGDLIRNPLLERCDDSLVDMFRLPDMARRMLARAENFPLEGNKGIFNDALKIAEGEGVKIDMKADRVLEAGCGDGSFLKFMLSSGYRAEGIEVNPRHHDAALPIRRMSLEKTDYPDATFKCVVTMHIFYGRSESPEQQAMLKEVGRILVPNGFAVITDVGRNWKWPVDLGNEYELDLINGWEGSQVDNGFVVRKVIKS
jgi:SAM-dependent methyltransferase